MIRVESNREIILDICNEFLAMKLPWRGQGALHRAHLLNAIQSLLGRCAPGPQVASQSHNLLTRYD